MRDLEIVEGVDIPVEFSEEQIDNMVTDVISGLLLSPTDDISNFMFGENDEFIMENFRKVSNILKDNIKEAIDYYTHIDGKTYIDDWSEFTERYITHTREQLFD